MICDMRCQAERIEQMIRYTLWDSGKRGIVVGLSGGVDSAVAAALSARAIGGENVLGLLMPSAVTAGEDLQDARDLCRQLGIAGKEIPIEPMLQPFRAVPGFSDTPYLAGNLMARIRMALLYYFANREERLVCGTSNRSEYMLGYTTKYGDSAADFQPILHLYKTEVYALAEDLGIPDRIRSKAPSAGLWKGQTDEGELGLSYADIDAALAELERDAWIPRSEVQERVLQLVKKSTHKRLSPPSLQRHP
ncbi:MAG: NAD+ synthase [Methanomicrobiales archaeon]|nr:NAD+ synthase [Methanomicrobiales archaeon]MDI6876162.1 NAD+ synthase [Methanomicrobiales archaeon]